ncbi:MAG: sulfurtransferase, partial [Ramlibacter sp.]|nr:sulfurtransferase [Ramlibacter sp.]
LPLLSMHALAAVFLVTFAARAGVPVPAAPLLVVAGAMGQSAQLPLMAVAAASVLANLAGDTVWFAAGKFWGHRVLRVVCRVSLSPDSCVRQSEDLVLRWGGSSLVAAKFLPGVSVVAAPMAGALGMRWPRFIGYGLLSGAVYTLVYLGLGMVFEARVERALDLLADAGVLGAVVLLALLAAFVGYRSHRRREFRRSADIPRIGVADLRAMMEGGHAPVIIDVRARASLQVDPRQIPGAINVEFARVEAFARELPRGREVVLYCNCPNEASAARAAMLLAQGGARRARPLAGGLDAWFAPRAPAPQVVRVPTLPTTR